MNEILSQIGAQLVDQLPKGVFLCVDGDVPNVMTIGWGGLAYYWRRHVFVAPVREQRHTYPMLKAAQAFTVCIPAPGDMADAVEKAGTLSGRDGDKFAAIGLQTQPAQKVGAPIIKGCAYYLECIVREQTDFSADNMDPSIVQGTYSAGDFHTLFYGEIVACYRGDTI